MSTGTYCHSGPFAVLHRFMDEMTLTRCRAGTDRKDERNVKLYRSLITLVELAAASVLLAGSFSVNRAFAAGSCKTGDCTVQSSGSTIYSGTCQQPSNPGTDCWCYFTDAQGLKEYAVSSDCNQ